MKQYKTLIFLLFSVALFANNGIEKKKKTIDKSFSVNHDAVLEVANKYGNINVSSWNQNTIKIHVEITVEGYNSAKVTERLNHINVHFKGRNDKVSAVTDLGKRGKWNNQTKVKINYDIKIPKSNHVYLTNDYGNIIIDEIDGRANIDLDYGNIEIGSLNNKSNNIVLDYANNSVIGNAKAANIDCDYGKLTIGNVDDLNFDSDYTDLNLGEADNFIYNMDYGSLNVGSVNNAAGNIDYTSQSFGTITKSLTLDTDYGSVSIGKLSPGFSSVTVESDYASVKIGVDRSVSYTLVADLNYGSVSTPNNFKVTEKVKKNNKTLIKGTAGNGSGKIIMSSNYGSLKIKQL